MADANRNQSSNNVRNEDRPSDQQVPRKVATETQQRAERKLEPNMDRRTPEKQAAQNARERDLRND